MTYACQLNTRRVRSESMKAKQDPTSDAPVLSIFCFNSYVTSINNNQLFVIEIREAQGGSTIDRSNNIVIRDETQATLRFVQKPNHLFSNKMRRFRTTSSYRLDPAAILLIVVIGYVLSICSCFMTTSTRPFRKLNVGRLRHQNSQFRYDPKSNALRSFSSSSFVLTLFVSLFQNTFDIIIIIVTTQCHQ